MIRVDGNGVHVGSKNVVRFVTAEYLDNKLDVGRHRLYSL